MTNKKPVFDIDNYKGDYAMHCTNKEDSITFCSFLHSINKPYYIHSTFWNKFGKETCYLFNEGLYDSKSQLLEENYKILEFSDFDWSYTCHNKGNNCHEEEKINCYDVIIVGAGPAGTMAAYKILVDAPELNVCLVDRGSSISDRHCPIRDNKTTKCVNCKPCSIMNGFGGAGTFSDCKLSLTPYVGGRILDYYTEAEAKKYIEKIDNIFTQFDEDAKHRVVIGSKDEENIDKIKKCADVVNVDFTECPTKHLGTDGTYKMMKNLNKFLLKHKNYTYMPNTEIVSCFKDSDFDENIMLTSNNGLKFKAKNVIFAPGRGGNTKLKEMLQTGCFGGVIQWEQQPVDIGVRIEIDSKYTDCLTDSLYDMKFSITDENGNRIRTFCTNPHGYVSEEHYDNKYAVVNGHSFANKKSDKTNFALLVTINDKNFNIDNVYDVIKGFKGQIFKQNMLELFKSSITAENSKTVTTTTFNDAVDRDLRNYLPYTVIHLVKKFIFKLGDLIDKCCDDYSITNSSLSDFLKSITIYGPEVKFYSLNVYTNNQFETAVSGLYCVGDGAGITRGIMQAATTGYIAAEDIIEKNKRRKPNK